MPKVKRSSLWGLSGAQRQRCQSTGTPSKGCSPRSSKTDRLPLTARLSLLLRKTSRCRRATCAESPLKSQSIPTCSPWRMPSPMVNRKMCCCNLFDLSKVVQLWTSLLVDDWTSLLVDDWTSLLVDDWPSQLAGWWLNQLSWWLDQLAGWWLDQLAGWWLTQPACWLMIEPAC